MSLITEYKNAKFAALLCAALRSESRPLVFDKWGDALNEGELPLVLADGEDNGEDEDEDDEGEDYLAPLDLRRFNEFRASSAPWPLLRATAAAKMKADKTEAMDYLGTLWLAGRRDEVSHIVASLAGNAGPEPVHFPRGADPVVETFKARSAQAAERADKALGARKPDEAVEAKREAKRFAYRARHYLGGKRQARFNGGPEREVEVAGFGPATIGGQVLPATESVFEPFTEGEIDWNERREAALSDEGGDDRWVNADPEEIGEALACDAVRILGLTEAWRWYKGHDGWLGFKGEGREPSDSQLVALRRAELASVLPDLTDRRVLPSQWLGRYHAATVGPHPLTRMVSIPETSGMTWKWLNRVKGACGATLYKLGKA
jgi:hypothetical protein